MILESAILNVKLGQAPEFEANFKEAQKILSSMPGYISHQLHKCIENSSQYILLVNWRSLEDHTQGFRLSEPYQEWKAMLHHFYEPFPTVEHYTIIQSNGPINGE